MGAILRLPDDRRVEAPGEAAAAAGEGDLRVKRRLLAKDTEQRTDRSLKMSIFFRIELKRLLFKAIKLL